MSLGYLIDVAILIAAHYFVWRLAPSLNQLEKYEFDNTSDGGVVRFKDFSQARSHQFKKLRLTLLAVLSAIVGFLALMSLMMFGDLGQKTAFAYVGVMVIGVLLYIFMPRRA